MKSTQRAKLVKLAIRKNNKPCRHIQRVKVKDELQNQITRSLIYMSKSTAKSAQRRNEIEIKQEEEKINRNKIKLDSERKTNKQIKQEILL